MQTWYNVDRVRKFIRFKNNKFIFRKVSYDIIHQLDLG